MQIQQATVQEITVRYQTGPKDKILLVTSLDDWEQAHQPTRTDAEAGLFAFEVSSEEPFFYFKPVLERDGERHLCSGSNLLAPFPEGREIYPAFFTSAQGTIGDLKMQEAEGGESYSYRVYLPPGYGENKLRTYPVCYMHDGHNLFFPEEAFAGATWEVHHTLELLDHMNSIEPCIVVGIHPNDRMVDYTNPGYRDYARMLIDHLVPAIEAEYQARTEATDRMVIGSSLGGLVSFYLCWEYSEVFGKAACLSSTFGFDPELIPSIQPGEKKPIKLYLDSGWPEDNFEVTQAMVLQLQQAGYVLGSEVLYLAIPAAEHNETSWASRLHLPFQFLLGLTYGADHVLDAPT